MIHIELTPRTEQRIAEEARIRGLRPETYAAQILEAAEPERKGKSVDAEAFLAGMLAFSHKTPVLSEEALTRESFYQDHD